VGVLSHVGPFDPPGHLVVKSGAEQEVTLYLGNGVSYSETELILGLGAYFGTPARL